MVDVLLILLSVLMVGVLFILWDIQYFGPLHSACTARTRYERVSILLHTHYFEIRYWIYWKILCIGYMDTVETAQYSVFRDSLAYCLYFEILSISALFIVLLLPILDISGCRYCLMHRIWRFDTDYTGQRLGLGTWILLKLLNTQHFDIRWRAVYTLRYSVFRPFS